MSVLVSDHRSEENEPGTGREVRWRGVGGGGGPVRVVTGGPREVGLRGLRAVTFEVEVTVEEDAGISMNCTLDVVDELRGALLDTRNEGMLSVCLTRRQILLNRLSSLKSVPKSESSIPNPAHSTTIVTLVRLSVKMRSMKSRNAKAMIGSIDLGNLARKW